VKGQPTGWNYAQAIKAIAVAEVQRDVAFNGITGLIVMMIAQGDHCDMEEVLEELKNIWANTTATGPGELTRRLAATLSWFLQDNDFRQAGTGIDKEDSDEIKEARKLLEMLT
jgi:hypothetical protein